MTKVRDIAKAIEEYAPTILKESYDNVGLMVGDNDKEVKKILLSLDCKLNTIEEAKNSNIDLIITHHPLLFRKPSRIIKEDLVGEKIINLIKNDISLYSCHTNLDSTENGINSEIMNVLGFNENTIMERSNIKGHEKAGIGRIVDLNRQMTPLEVIDMVKSRLEINNIKASIGYRPIKKIAVINGSGQDYFEMARKMNADCIITGDTTYHYVSDYKEMGITVIDDGHFNTENIIFLKIMRGILQDFNDVEVIESKYSEDVYKFL